MGLIEELLGCSLIQIDRSYWAVKLSTDEWICEARVKTDFYTGRERFFDWSNDLVANSETEKIKELWLLCPPTATSPLGNTAMLEIGEPGTAFQFKIGMVDSNVVVSNKSMQAHIIGRVDNKENGDCTCFIFDPIQEGLLTPATFIYDKNSPQTGFKRANPDGTLSTVGKTNIFRFHSWRDSIAPLGIIEHRAVGIRL